MINAGNVIESCPALLLVALEDRFQGGQHGVVIGVAGERGIGGGEQAAAQPLEIEALLVGERGEDRLAGGEEGSHAVLGSLVLSGDLIVISAVGIQQGVVIGEEGAEFGRPIIPDQGGMATGAQDPGEFSIGSERLEPVEGLAGNN